VQPDQRPGIIRRHVGGDPGAEVPAPRRVPPVAQAAHQLMAQPGHVTIGHPARHGGAGGEAVAGARRGSPGRTPGRRCHARPGRSAAGPAAAARRSNSASHGRDLADVTAWSRDNFMPYLGNSFAEIRDAVTDTSRNARLHTSHRTWTFVSPTTPPTSKPAGPSRRCCATWRGTSSTRSWRAFLVQIPPRAARRPKSYRCRCDNRDRRARRGPRRGKRVPVPRVAVVGRGVHRV
jgi:hypothetical protein